jgi:hypothetical protein
MGLFKNLETKGLEQSEDRIGGFQAIDTRIYPVTVKALYAGESKSGAMNLTLVALLDDGKEYKETVYITNKKKENFFVKDGKKQPLPGFTLMNDLCLIACDKELNELDTEEKVVKLYDYEQKKELPTAVQMVTEALGKKVALGILRVLENKQKKNDSTGEYEPVEETREVNRIDKIFHPEAKVTVAEARTGKTEGEFWFKWNERNEGQVRDERDIKDGQGGGAGSSPKTPPKAGSGAAAPKKSLFSK